MENIESKAVKQETFDLLPGLRKALARDEEETVDQDMIATFDNVAIGNEQDGGLKMDEEPLPNEGDEQKEEDFIKALKDIDKFKEDEDDLKRAEEADR